MTGSVLVPGTVAGLKASDTLPGSVWLKVPGDASKFCDAIHGSILIKMNLDRPRSFPLAAGQVSGLQEGGNGKYKCEFTDGQENIPGLLTSQVGKRHGAQLKDNDMVQITEGNINSLEDKKILVVADLNVAAAAEGLLAPSPVPAEKTAVKVGGKLGV